MRLLQFKIKLAKHFWSTALSDNEQPKHEWFITQSNYALEWVLQILVWDSGGHLVS